MSRTDLAKRIINQRFRILRFAAGYDLDQVDNFLDSIVSGLANGTEPSQLRQLIDRAKFTETRWRSGYSITEVDDYLQYLIREIRALPHSPAR